MNLQQELQYLYSELKRNSNKNRAKGEKKYMKSPHRFYGVDTPTKRKIVKAWLKNHKTTSIDEIVNLSEKLWDSDSSEEKDLAIQLLQYRNRELTLGHLSHIENMINTSTGWSHLDEIAKWLIGGLIDNNPKTLKYLPKWSKSKNFWVRRAALLGQIIQFRRKEGNKKLFFKLAIKEFDEGKNWSKEERFFIRKAIGWTLREIAEKQPEITYQFVKKHAKEMSGLTFREATRKLPATMRQELVKLRK